MRELQSTLAKTSKPAASSSTDAPRLLVDLELGDCRYAVAEDGEGRHLFCGAATGDSLRPYCACHAALVGAVPRMPAEKRLAAELRAAGRAQTTTTTFASPWQKAQVPA